MEDPYGVEQNRFRSMFILLTVIAGVGLSIVIFSRQYQAVNSGDVAGEMTEEEFAEEEYNEDGWVDYNSSTSEESSSSSYENYTGSDVKESYEEDSSLVDKVTEEEELSPDARERELHRKFNKIRREESKKPAVCGDNVLEVGDEQCESDAHCGDEEVCNECECVKA